MKLHEIFDLPPQTITLVDQANLTVWLGLFMNSDMSKGGIIEKVLERARAAKLLIKYNASILKDFLNKKLKEET